MFAIYKLPGKKDTTQFLGLSSLYFKVHYGKNQFEIPLEELNRIILEKRRKLAPLILGGIITSLGLLSIFLFSSGLEIVAIVAFGLLLTYFGIQEYVVIHIEHSNNTRLIWLPLKIQLEKVRPFIAILEYYLSKQNFPVLYVVKPSLTNVRLVHYEDKPVESDIPVFYTFRNILDSDTSPIIVNPLLLDMPITISGENRTIGSSDYLINQSALIANNQISFT